MRFHLTIPTVFRLYGKISPHLGETPPLVRLDFTIPVVLWSSCKSEMKKTKGLSYLTQLRVGLSKLNFHKFKHNFRDTINPMCPTSDGIEDTEHYLLLCPSFDVQRQDLLARVAELLRSFVQITDLSNDALTQLLLYGNQDLSNDLNRNILELTLRFIHETGRFD